MIDLLAKNAHASDPNEITFWHISDNPEALKSFLNNGAQAIGKGYGGQTTGFYVWNRKENAVSHLTDFLGEGKAIEGLLIGVTLDKDKLTYPNWQFDVEQAKKLNSLFFKYKESISEIKNLDYIDDDGTKRIIDSIKISRFATEQKCNLIFKSSFSRTNMSIGDSGIRVAEFQALIDTLCKNPKFREDYNKLLQESATTSKRLALKYCGKEHLPVNEAIHIQKDEKEKVRETILYTSSLPKEKQECPFLKMRMLRKKGPMGM